MKNKYQDLISEVYNLFVRVNPVSLSLQFS